MYHLRRSLIVIIVLVAAWFAITALHKHLDPNTTKSEEEKEDAAWVASSKHWLDRQSCRWIGICGLAHWHPDPATRPWNRRRADREWEYAIQDDEDDVESRYLWEDIPGAGERVKPGDWDGDPRVLKDVPQYVLDHAPLIHLYSGEQFWPSDIGKHLTHMIPFQNYSMIEKLKRSWSPTLDNLHELNQGRRGRELFMHSQEDVEDRPDWLSSAANKPIPYDDEEEEEDEEEVLEYTEISTGAVPSQEDIDTWFEAATSTSEANVTAAPKITKPFSQSYRSSRPELRRRGQNIPLEPVLPKPGGYSRAPAILVLVDKGHGILDAFWFYFYSFNLGTTVLGIRFGNHVGDWEHSLIRFHNGVPKAIFFSAHSGGLAYSYDAVEKSHGKGREGADGKGRPVLYSAVGSHAMYATPGKHPYVLPFGMLADVTDRGPLWDPSLNYYAYHFNTSITHNASARALLPSPSHPSPILIPDSPTDLSAQNPLTSSSEPQSAYVHASQTIRIMSDSLQPAAQNPTAPMGWWWYAGRWGDKFYELSDIRQWRFVGQYHYVNGPLGPRFKNLGRSRVCQSRGSCTIVDSLKEKRSWLGK